MEVKIVFEGRGQKGTVGCLFWYINILLISGFVKGTREPTVPFETLPSLLRKYMYSLLPPSGKVYKVNLRSYTFI